MNKEIVEDDKEYSLIFYIMDTFNYTFKNNGFGEYNDDVFNHLFDLTNSEYIVRILPNAKTGFWQFGIRLSKTENIEFYYPTGKYKTWI